MVLRWGRLAAWLLLLLLLLVGLYLHQSGVPGPVRDLIVAAVRSRGVELGFERLRLHWYHGLVADRVSVEIGRGPAPTRVECAQVVIHLDWRALLRQQVEVRGLELRGGQLVLPLAGPNEPTEDFVLDGLATRLRWEDGSTWFVDEFSAQAFGAILRGHGTLTNGPALWRRPRTPVPPPATARPPALAELRERVRALKRLADRVTFTSPPEVLVRVSGDAADPATWAAEVQTRGVTADTPWGRLQGGQIQTRLLNAASNGLAAADLRLDLGALTTAWGNLQSVHLKAWVSRPWGQPAASRLDWECTAAEVVRPGLRVEEARLLGQTVLQPSLTDAWTTTFEASAGALEVPGARVGHAGLRGRANHRLDGAWPHDFTAHLNVEQVAAGGVDAATAQVDLEVQAREPVPAGVPQAAPWNLLAPFTVGFAVRVGQLRAPQLELESLLASGRWRFPDLSLTNVQARLLDGTVQVTQAHLDVSTRDVSAEVAVDFDVQKLDRALPANALRWLAQFQYPRPPHALARARVRLPPWGAKSTNLGPDLLATLDLQVRLDGENASYRGLTCDVAGVTLSISNQVLRLRDLAVRRPEGRAALTYDLDLRRRDFRWRIECELDAAAAAPAVDATTLVPIVGLFGFSAPPRITGEVWGNWNPPRPLGLALHLAATNFTFRGEAFDSLTADLQKTNQFVSASSIRITRGPEWLEVPWVQYDLTNRVVALTNARSQMDPLVIARCIGTSVEETLSPYRFARPPEVFSGGVIPVGGDLAAAAMDFEVVGEAFSFWRFNLPQVKAGVRWRGDLVSVTNVAAGFYGGRVSGGIDLELLGAGDAFFRFQALATEFDLQALMRDVLPSTNRLEGRGTVSLIVTDAHTADWGSWYGRGQAEMHDGVIWDLPIFGMFSTVVNAMIPGLGNSRASAARATYRMQKSVIHTDDLAIAAGPARLQYKGSVDFDGRIDARVIAEVLHGTPLIGPLISLALSPAAKAMEFKVTGTLADPVIKPLHVPGFLLPFLNPLGTLQNLVVPPAKPAATPPTP